MSSVETGLVRFVDEKLVFPNLTEKTLDGVVAELSAHLERAGVVRSAEDLARRLIERERMGSTGLGAGLAIPHCKLAGLADVVLAVGVSRIGIDFGAPDGVPVNLVFLVLSPADAPALHLQALARISRAIRTPGVDDALLRQSTPEGIAAVLRGAERPIAT